MRYINRSHPATGLEGKFSLQYVVVAALIDGKVDLDTFNDSQVQREDFCSLLSRVVVIENPQIPANFNDMWIVVMVTLNNGKTIENKCVKPKGIWGEPLSRNEVLEKVENCAGRVLDRQSLNEFISLVDNLENASAADVKRLLAILTPTVR